MRSLEKYFASTSPEHWNIQLRTFPASRTSSFGFASASGELATSSFAFLQLRAVQLRLHFSFGFASASGSFSFGSELKDVRFSFASASGPVQLRLREASASLQLRDFGFASALHLLQLRGFGFASASHSQADEPAAPRHRAPQGSCSHRRVRPGGTSEFLSKN